MSNSANAIALPESTDIAFSFLAQDEQLALQMSERLQGRVSTFVYSERQRDLIGTDGVERFSHVFRKASTLVVILYREQWGTTRWTRIEKSAIESRGVEKGWASIILVNLDHSTPPVWFPSRFIWADLDQYGAQATVAVIEARYREQNGVVHSETPVERAQRLVAEQQHREEREYWLRSPAGIAAATDQVRDLFARLQAMAAEITRTAPGLDITYQQKPGLNPLVCLLRSIKASVTLAWTASFGSGQLYVREWRGAYSFDGMAHPRFGPKVVGDVHIHPALDERGDLYWRAEDDADRLYSVPQLVERYINRLVDRAVSDDDEPENPPDRDHCETIDGYPAGY